MQQPPFPSAVPPPIPNPDPSSLSAGGGSTSSGPKRKKLPTAEELVAHYESQGLEKQEASMKVIDDLQKALYRLVTTSGRGKKDKFMADTSRKLDAASTRLAILEMKLDAKPGYPETLAIGLASGAALRGIGAAIPHVVAAAKQIWTAVQKTTSKT